MKVLLTLISIIFSITVISQRKIDKISIAHAKTIDIFLKDKTKIGKLLIDADTKSKIVLIRSVRSKNLEGIIFTNFLFAEPSHLPVQKIKISFSSDKEIDNAYCTISETYKNLFQQTESDKKGFMITADSLSKHSVIRVTVQSKIPVLATIKGAKGKSDTYIIHEHEHHH